MRKSFIKFFPSRHHNSKFLYFCPAAKQKGQEANILKEKRYFCSDTRASFSVCFENKFEMNLAFWVSALEKERLKMKMLFKLMVLFVLVMAIAQEANAQYENEIAKEGYTLVSKELKTEQDGFQWYLYSFTSPYGGIRYGAVNIEGRQLSEYTVNDFLFDEKTSGYIPSHKVFLWGFKHEGGGLSRGGFYGSIYTCKGRMIAKLKGVSSVKYYDYGIIIADEYSGVYYNNMVIVPFNHRDIHYVDNCYVCHVGNQYKNKYDIYTDEGKLMGSDIDDYQTIDGKLYYCDGDNIFDNTHQIIAKGKIKEVIQNNNISYLLVERTPGHCGLYDITGHELIPPIYKQIIKCENHSDLLIKVITDNNRAGLFDSSGAEILAAEFEDCDFIGNNLFKFKMNGYWGVMNRKGKVIIPLSRQYAKIDYSRTLGTFTFVREDGAKGECNASGMQTSISKTKEKTNNVTSNTTKTNSNNSNQAKSTSNSSKPSNNNTKDEGLLYQGEYTVSEDVGSMVEMISIYEDRVCTGVNSFAYKSTNASGERVYAGDGAFGVFWRFYVRPNYNIRIIKEYPNPYTGIPTTVTCKVTKGASSMPVQNGGGYYDGGGSAGTYNGRESGSGTTTQSNKHECGLCRGTGEVIENNATSFGNTKYCNKCGKTVPDSHYHTTCPSCKGKGYW